MISPSARRAIGTLVAAAFVVTLGRAADNTSARTDAGKASPASTPSASTRPASTSSRSVTGKGPLPDPALLDGSTQPAEKRPEQGMIGDFELPGDENVRSGKVGGQQNPNATAGGPQQQGMPMGLPKMGGGGGQPGQQQGGGAMSQQQAGAQQAGGGQAGPENPNANGNPVAGGGDPGAQPQGVQVAQLGGEASAQGAGAVGAGDRPPPVTIGDSAMRIEPSASAAGVVGQQQQVPGGYVQQHEKGTGTGGKGSGGSQGGNRVEKGRTIPAGL